MNDAELKAKVMLSVENRKGEFMLIKKSIEDLVMNVAKDSIDVVKELDDAKKVAGLVIDIVDDLTKTGVLDTVDGMLAKMAFNAMDNDKIEEWWANIRKKIIAIEA